MAPHWPIVWHGRKCGAAATTASKSISVQALLLLPGLMVDILNFGCRPMSDHVARDASDISESGVVENVGVAAKTVSKFISV